MTSFLLDESGNSLFDETGWVLTDESYVAPTLVAETGTFELTIVDATLSKAPVPQFLANFCVLVEGENRTVLVPSKT